jgi:hypothetical protein
LSGAWANGIKRRFGLGYSIQNSEAFMRTLSGLALACSLFLCGCGGSPLSKSNYDKIQNGMTAQEVGALFGFDEDFEKLQEDRTMFLNKTQASKLGVDRLIDFPAEGEMIHIYSTKEMGGVNKKQIQVRFRDGQVEWKDQENVQ